jgi:hypothetical protein
MSIRSGFTDLRHILLAASAALLLAACGGGSQDAGSPASATQPPQVDISGLAATGAAIVNGTVTAINARGEKATGQSNGSGAFTVKVNDGAPYLLSVVDGAGKTWYSYAQGAGRANLNPMTTLALLQANGHKPLADLAAGWATQRLTAEQVLEAAKVLNANLFQVMSSKGVAASSTNIFIAEFSANGIGLDAVLDAMRVTIDCSPTSCTQTITSSAGSTLVSWDASIATDGFSFSWSNTTDGGSIGVGLGSCRAPQAGTYSLQVSTTVSGVGSAPIPEICIDGLQTKPASLGEFCGNGTVMQHLPPGVLVLSCSYDGTSGVIAARLGGPLRVEYSVRFTFVKR